MTSLIMMLVRRYSEEGKKHLEDYEVLFARIIVDFIVRMMNYDDECKQQWTTTTSKQWKQ